MADCRRVYFTLCGMQLALDCLTDAGDGPLESFVVRVGGSVRRLPIVGQIPTRYRSFMAKKVSMTAGNHSKAKGKIING